MNSKNLLLIAAAGAAGALAQDRMTIPLSNPSQPATVNVHLISGSITVTAGSASQVVVDMGASGGRRGAPNPLPVCTVLTPGAEALTPRRTTTP